jgi:hypothetical protein
MLPVKTRSLKKSRMQIQRSGTGQHAGQEPGGSLEGWPHKKRDDHCLHSLRELPPITNGQSSAVDPVYSIGVEALRPFRTTE